MSLRKCLVNGCSSTSKTASVCWWPRSKQLERVWIDILTPRSSKLTSSLKHRGRVDRNFCVCKIHFEEKFFNNEKRVAFSWPTLFTEQEILTRKPLVPVTVSVQTVNDHSYAVPVQTNAALVYQKRKWSQADVEIALNVKSIIHDQSYAFNANKTMKLSIQSEMPTSSGFEVGGSRISAEKLDLENNSNANNVDGKQQNNLMDGLDIGKLNLEHSEGIDMAIRNILSASNPSGSKPCAEDIPVYEDNDHDNDIPESALQSLQESKKEEPVFSWEKRVEVVPADDADAIIFDDLPSEISLYCDDDDIDVISPNQDADKAKSVVPDYQCNECRGVITGFRYTCVQCCDFDLCAACEACATHSAHYVLRVPGDRPYSEIQSVLAAIRQQILSEKLFLSVADDSVKTEIKLEPDIVPPDSSKDPVLDLNGSLPDVNEPCPEENDHLPDVNNSLPDVNDSLQDVNYTLPDLNEPSPELHDHFPELEDPLPDLTPLTGPDPLSGTRSDSENSHAESFEESDSDYSPPRSPEASISQTEDPIPTISSDDSDTGDSDHSPCKRMRATPFSTTYGDLIDLSHLKILQNVPAPSLDSNQRESIISHQPSTEVNTPQLPQEMANNLTIISSKADAKFDPTQKLATSRLRTPRSIDKSVHPRVQSKEPVFSKPAKVVNQEQREKTEVTTESYKMKRKIFVAFKATRLRFPLKSVPVEPLQSSEDPIISRLDAQRQITVNSDSDPTHKAPEGSRKFVPHILRRRSPRKRKLVSKNPIESSEDLTMRRSDHERQERVVEDEATETVQETSEQISSEQPDSEQMSSEQPDSEQMSSEQPDSEQMSSEQPDSEQMSSEQPDICMRLPPDTNEAALIKALQYPVTVRLTRDF